MNPLRPRKVVPSIFAIDFEELRRLGMRAVVFDLDRTLRDPGPNDVKPEVLSLLERLTERGFRVGILTNRRPLEEDPLHEALAKTYPLCHTARKPSKRGFLSLLRTLETPPERAVMVGDRLLTDVLGANRLGMYSIRIRPEMRTGRSRRRPGG
ncbi:MAG: HAD-IIIA family hydrolase [Candidatus Bipolaricaulota bacterium]|jgi:hypothetical protein|nr:HAD-IIIA family hydrolase [Candidatus Bipolaricaulota bacterium]